MDHDILASLIEWVRSRHFGKYRGVVVGVDDETGRGRIKVKVPAVLSTLEVWAMPCVPYAGEGVGFWSLPAEGSGVWVEFEGGDPSYPIWTGCFWADGEAPEEGDPAVRTWRTGEVAVRLDEDNDELALRNSGAEAVFSEDISATAGEAKLTVGSSGVVSEKGGNKIEVGDSSVRINNGALEVLK